MFLLPVHVVGLCWDSTDAATLGRLSPSLEEQQARLTAWRTRGVACVLLATCHRIELYWWGDADLSADFAAWMHERAGADAPLALYAFDADLAIRHLFAVSAGLRSQRIGEPEILGQVRRAWAVARELHCTSPALDTLVQRAIVAARHIRRRAGLDQRDVSLGDASARLIAHECGVAGAIHPDDERRAVVVGTGLVARSVIRAMAAQSWTSITVLSRTVARAHQLAQQFDVASASWTDHPTAIAAADVVVFATRAPTPLITESDANLIETATARGALWLDLGVPANVAPALVERGLRLRTLGDLAHADAPATISAARVALQQELARFAAELQRRSLDERWPVIERAVDAVALEMVQRLPGRAIGENAAQVATHVARRITQYVRREIAREATRESGQAAVTESTSIFDVAATRRTA